MLQEVVFPSFLTNNQGRSLIALQVFVNSGMRAFIRVVPCSQTGCHTCIFANTVLKSLELPYNMLFAPFYLTVNALWVHGNVLAFVPRTILVLPLSLDLALSALLARHSSHHLRIGWLFLQFVSKQSDVSCSAMWPSEASLWATAKATLHSVQQGAFLDSWNKAPNLQGILLTAASTALDLLQRIKGLLWHPV